MRVIIIQPAVPTYRVGLFDRLAARLGAGFKVCASSSSEFGALGVMRYRRTWEHNLGPIVPILSGLNWQVGAVSLPVSQGDVLVVCGAPRTLSTLALIIKGKLRGARTIWWGHYWTATSKRWRAALRFALMRLPDAIIFYTEAEVKEYIAQYKGRQPKPAFGLNNGIETCEIVKLRESYSATERPRDLFFIGRITEKAELGLLLEALSRPECAELTLDVVGDGPELDKVKQKAVYLGLSERIHWHGPCVEEPQIALVANRCRAFVYPGSVGLSLVHGLAYGLPAIVHEDRWRQMPEFAALAPGKNGVTFRRGCASDLAGSISALLADPLGLEKLSTSAVATTDRSFNASDMAERFFEAINLFNSSSDISGKGMLQ